jgi:hypothetical protein
VNPGSACPRYVDGGPRLAPLSSCAELGAFDAWRGLERLAILWEEQRLLDSELQALVVHLAQLGVNWAELGRSLGMSRQGARQRFGSQAAATAVVVPTGTSV